MVRFGSYTAARTRHGAHTLRAYSTYILSAHVLSRYCTSVRPVRNAAPTSVISDEILELVIQTGDQRGVNSTHDVSSVTQETNTRPGRPNVADPSSERIPCRRARSQGGSSCPRQRPGDVSAASASKSTGRVTASGDSPLAAESATSSASASTCGKATQPVSVATAANRAICEDSIVATTQTSLGLCTSHRM